MKLQFYIFLVLVAALALCILPPQVASQDDPERGAGSLDVIVRVIEEDDGPISEARVVVRDIREGSPDELADRPEPRHEHMEAQGTTGENGTMTGGTSVTTTPGVLYGTVHACGTKFDFHISGSTYAPDSGALKPVPDAENFIDSVESALTESPAPGIPIAVSLPSLDATKYVAYRVVVVDCDETEVEPTEDDFENEDVSVSVDNELDEGWTYDARDYGVEVTNKDERDMTDFKICIPDSDDDLTPSPLSQEDADDVVQPESGGVPDGWSYRYTDKDGDGDNDCLYFYTDGDNYQPVEQGETGSFGVTSGYDDKGNIGTVQYTPSYWDGSEHREGESTEGFGPVPFAMNSEGPERALRTGAGNAETTVASVSTPGMGERIEEWRSDIQDRYNPAVEEGDVPGFVSNLMERRMLVSLRENDRYVAVRTEPDGAVSSVKPVSDEEVDEFNQQVTVDTTAETVDSIRTSENPSEAAQSALRNGDVRLRGENTGASWKTRAGTAGAKVAGEGPEEIYGEENVEESELGYRYVETRNDTDTSSGMNTKTVVDRNGGVRGVTTEGCQELIEAGGTERLSENAGVYGSREMWEGETRSRRGRGG